MAAVNMDPLTPEKAPYTGWSPFPGSYPPVQKPMMQGPLCPLLPVSCGSLATGKCVVPAQQPVVPVPVYQEIQRKDRIIEVPQTIITDKIIPRLFKQDVFYDKPKLSVNCNEKPIRIPGVEFREKIIEVPVPVAYNYKVVSKWEVREVPKLIQKFTGKQEEIYIDVPQVTVVDKNIEKEVPVYVGEKIVKKQVIEEEPVDVIEYKYVEKYEEVPVYKYKPVFDVEVDIPPPLIVPVPVQPKEVQIEPERISFAEWKRKRLDGASQCCSQGGVFGPNQGHSCLCQCSACCQPGGCLSPGGFLSATCQGKPCCCCGGEDGCKCCDSTS